jgi:AmmeMemoRadiSam system protein A
MAPTPSPDRAPLDTAERAALLDIAWRAVRAGLEVPWIDIDLAALPERLAEPGASFVSLHRAGRLRGCMGRLEATRPLAEDVAGNARAAAYFDPRFPALAPEELAGLELEISVLTPSVPLEVGSESDLLATLRPGVDGLILIERQRRATFLPTVWRELPDPRDFLGHLKRKAGLPAGHWSESLRFERYTTESIA